MAKKEEEQKKTLHEALKEFENKFGKGSLVKGNETNFVKVETTSTGSIKLDKATKVGGIPKGGLITQILGKESSSKCMDKNAYVLTAEGYKTVEEIFIENGVPLYTANKEVKKEILLINKDKEEEKTTHFTLNGKRKTWKIKTRTGFEFIRTYKHPILTISESGNLIWKWAGELKKGDYIVKKHKEVFGTNTIPKDESYAIGALIADGGFYKNRVGFTNDDPCVIKYIPVIERMTGIKAKVYPCSTNNSSDWHFNSTVGINKFYNLYGFKVGVAKDKTIPLKIRNSNKETLVEFIKGYMDSESHIDSKGIHVTSASKELLYQLKLILTQFCINSFLVKKIVKNYEHNDYYQLSIYAVDTYKFINKIGTNSLKIKSRYEEWIKKRNLADLQKNTNFYSIPNVVKIIEDIQRQDAVRNESISNIISDGKKANFTYVKLEKLNSLVKDKDNILLQHLNFLAEYEYEEVIENSFYDVIPTFDFAMEKTHTFEADGFINHNTTLSLHLIAEEQKKGGLCCFLDIEGTLDLNYAQQIGVDLNMLYILDPESFLKSKKGDSRSISGEEWMDMLVELIKTNEFGFIVVDSVTTLTPQAELENGMRNASIAQLGRLMSKSLRSINAALMATNTGLIFLNQYRTNLTGYGNPYIESGGEALKYYTALKIEIAKTLDKDTDGVYGIVVKAKITKSKVGVPYGECNYYVEFGKGISKIKETIDVGIELGIINKSGSWYSYGDAKIGQGEDNVEIFLLDNPEIYEDIKQKIKEQYNA